MTNNIRATIDIGEFSVVNHKRSKEIYPACKNWTPADWMTALIGEIGEAANWMKKMKRLEGHDGDVFAGEWEQHYKYRQELGKELADAFSYIDLLATSLGIDLEQEVIDKWNEVSEKKDYPFRIGS